MIETLTAILIVLSIFALALIGLVLYFWLTSEGECPTCGGSGRSVVHKGAGLMQVRCPTCHR